MLEALKELPDGIDGLKAIGWVSKHDYDRVFAPLIDRTRRHGRRLRLLYELGPAFAGLEPGAEWEGAKLSPHATATVAGCAVVTESESIRRAAQVLGFTLPWPLKVFDGTQFDAAVKWLQALPETLGASHELLPELGVLVVDITDPLRVQDFDALASDIDAWVQTHGKLQGLVIHAPHFPGWDDVGAFARHVRFVRDHHQKIARVALAVDGLAAGIMTQLVHHVGTTQLHGFSYGDLKRAIAWAAADVEATHATAPSAHASPVKEHAASRGA